MIKIAQFLKTAETSWLDQEVVNPQTGNHVKVKSLPSDEQQKYKPHHDLSDVKKKARNFGLKVKTQHVSWGPHATIHDTKSNLSTKGNVFFPSPETNDFLSRLKNFKDSISDKEVLHEGNKVYGLK